MGTIPTPVLKHEVIGGYGVSYCNDGSYRIKGPDLRPRGVYVPSDSVVRERYGREQSSGRISSTTNTWLSMLGIVYSGKKSMKEGKKALGISYREPVSLEKLRQEIRFYWPAEELADVIEKGLVPKKRLKDFKKDHKQEGNSMEGPHGGAISVLGSMEYPYSEAYPVLTGRKARKSIDRARLQRQLYEWYCLGKPISVTVLRESPVGTKERQCYDQINTLARISMTPRTTTEVITELTGLDPEEVQLGSGSQRRFSHLVERLTSFAFHWAQVVGTNIDGIPNQQVYTTEDMRRFFYNGSQGISDLRVGDHSVEVKSYIGYFSDGKVNDLIKRYSPRRHRWVTGEPMNGSTVVFLQPEETYSKGVGRLKEAGINVVSHKQFYDSLKNVVNEIKKSHLPRLEGLSPRANLDYILCLGQEILRPSLLMKEGNLDRRTWSHHMLKAMTERAKEISEGYLETSDGESYLRIPGGRVVRHSNGRFLLVERDFEDIPSGSIGDFIKSNFGNFLLTNLRSSFPDLARVAKDKILAFDLETLGFKYSDPIIAAGFTRLSRRSFQSGVLFARDYSEEGPMLDYLLGMLNDQDVVITYNGSSFDFPRLQERAKLNGIFLNGFSPISFCGQSKKKHIDLYPLVRQRFKSANNRLQHLEKLMFDYERPDDIPSKEIPDVYREHVMKGNHNRMLEKVIDHCMMDTVTLMGVLGKLSKR